MKQLQLPLLILLLGLTVCLSSCVKDVDVNQEESIAPVPLLESELMTSALEAKDFIESGDLQELRTVTDTLNMASIRSNFFIDEMKNVSLSLKFINSLDAGFKIDFEFLNDANESKYAVHVPVSSGSIEKPVSVETIVTIKEPELKIFKEATKLVYRISVLPDSKPFSPDTEGDIALQSKAYFSFDM